MSGIEQTGFGSVTILYARTADSVGRCATPIGWAVAGSVRVGEAGSGPGQNGQAWIHRQNIVRYRALLANPAKLESHAQVRKLLAEEEEKLRALGESDAAPDRDNPV